MIANKDLRPPGVAPPEEGALNACAGGAPRYDAAAIQHVPKGFMGKCIQIGVGDPPLPAAYKINTRGAGQRLDESLAIRFPQIVGMQQRDIFDPRVCLYLIDILLVEGSRVSG